MATFHDEEDDVSVYIIDRKANLNRILTEEIFWKQSVKSFQPKKWDCNSHFFYAQAFSMKCFNFVDSLHNSIGDRVTDKEGIWTLIMDYFSNFFFPTRENYEPDTNLIELKISPLWNENLIALTAEEIKRVAFQMHLDKSLGPDGINPTFFFFQKFWDIVGDSVIQVANSLILAIFRTIWII